MSLLGLAHWVAVLVGVVIGWCGIRSFGRISAVLVSLLALWIGPALITAVGAATGTRNLLKYPADILDYGVGVLRVAAALPELVVPPLVTAIAVGVVVFVLRRSLHARSAAVADPT